MIKFCWALSVLGLVACSTSYPTPSTSDEARPGLPDFAAEARRAIDVFNATGMVAAVTIDGEVVFEQAFGKADENTDAPFTTDTVVPIASISKAFTSTALAILVDRKLVEWDEPIQTYIPEFKMYDPWVSEHFTVRDALTHRSGLPLGAGDLLFWPDAKSNIGDILHALPHLPPSTGFREAYAYDNLLYVVAGEIIARVSGKSWADFIEAEILAPVGMDNCAADLTRLRPDQTLVTGHERAVDSDHGTPVRESMLFKPDHAAAGGIVCPVSDMMTWAQFWLNDGVTEEGVKLVSQKQLAELWTGVTPFRAGPDRDVNEANIFGIYGLGWALKDFEGRLMVTHSGGAPGVVSNFILLPEQNIGIFAASNDYRATAKVFTNQIADALIGNQDFDRISDAGDWFPKELAKAQASMSSALSPPASAAARSLPLEAYTGIYRDKWYGDVSIYLRDGQLSIDMSRSEVLDGPLVHYEGERFVAAWPDRSLKADAFVTFELEGQSIKGFTMKAVSSITDFSYDFHDLDLVRVSER